MTEQIPCRSHGADAVAAARLREYNRSLVAPDTAKPWFFDVWSRFYDEALIQRLVYRPLHEALLAALGRQGPATVLDLGCGTGLLTTRLRRQSGVVRVTGADFSSGMLAQARARGADIDWVRASAQALPFADSSFDAIASCEAFHWFPDQAAALAECARVLKPGGCLYLAFVNPSLPGLGDLAYLVSKAVGQPFYWPSPTRMAAMLEEAGLEVQSQQRVFRVTLPLLLTPVLSVARRPRRRTRQRTR